MTKLAVGNLKVLFKERQKGGKEAFIKDIQANVKTVKSATMIKQEQGIINYNLEEGTDKDDVKNALAESVGIPVTGIQLNEIRKGKFGLSMGTA